MKKNFGFNLIEMLIVLIVFSLLSIMAFPMYSQHMTKIRRAEATATLQKLAIALEKYHLIHSTYKYSTLSKLEFNEIIADNHYQLVIAKTSDQDFLIEAKPLQKEIICGTLTLNAQGTKGVTGSESLTKCW